MYVPAHFAAADAEVRRLLVDHGAADLITPTAQGLVATLLPFVFDPGPADGGAAGSVNADAAEYGALLGHVARNNPHWSLPPTGESLVIVRGPDAYISPAWYASKAEHGKVVPTWNYLTAHVYGRLVIHDDVEWVAGLVRRLTEKHESRRVAESTERAERVGSAEGEEPAGRSGEVPWTVDDAPQRFIAGQLRAIVGVELRISRIEAKAKLSQNRPAADVDGVIAGLRERGDQRSALAVEQARAQ